MKPPIAPVPVWAKAAVGTRAIAGPIHSRLSLIGAGDWQVEKRLCGLPCALDIHRPICRDGLAQRHIGADRRKAGRLIAVTNHDAADAELVVLATVWDAAVATSAAHADQLAGKAVISMANGLVKHGREFRATFPEEGSIAEAIQAAAPEARVVAALQHIPAAALGDLDHDIESDVLVVGDDDQARTKVLDLIDAVPGLRAFDAGSLANARGIEAVAAPLLTINLRHKGEATLRIDGAGERRG